MEEEKTSKIVNFALSKAEKRGSSDGGGGEGKIDLGKYVLESYRHGKKKLEDKGYYDKVKSLWETYLIDKGEKGIDLKQLLIRKREERKIYLCQSMVSLFVAYLTENMPIHYVRASKEVNTDDKYIKMAKTLENKLQEQWKTRKWQRELIKAINDVGIMGNGALKVIWNPALEQGIGDIDIGARNLLNLVIDPYCNDDISNAKYVIEEIDADREDIAMAFNVDEESLPVDEDISGNISETHKLKWEIVEGENTFRKRTKLLSGWFLRWDKTGGNPVQRWWIITICKSNGKVLAAKKTDLSRHPYFLFNGFEKPGLLKLSLNEILKPLQDIAIEHFTKIEENIDSIGNSKIITILAEGQENVRVSDGSVLELIEVSQPERVRFQGGIPVGQDRFQLLNLVFSWKDILSGLHWVSQGGDTPNARTGVAVKALQEASLTKVRLNEKDMTRVITEIGYYCIELILKNYITERDMVNAEGGTEKIDLRNLENKFTVEVAKGSTLPVDKTGRMNTLLQVLNIVQGVEQNIGMPGLTKKVIENIYDVLEMNTEWQGVLTEVQQEQQNQLGAVATAVQPTAGMLQEMAGQPGAVGTIP